MLEISII